MSWRYTRREDGKVAVTIDNNVWDFLLNRGIDLASELPPDKFLLFIPREVEIEAAAIKDNKKKAYIWDTILKHNIQTTHTFGFAEFGMGGGFQGRFQSQTEIDFYALISEQWLLGRKEKGSGLSGNEADAAVAALSFFSVVLTMEKPNKTGPLRIAAEHGGKVLYLRNLNKVGLSLREYIEDCYQRP